MFVSERGEIHVELESDVERRVRGRKWERKMSAGIDMSSGRRARCLSHPRFFAAHGMGMVFSSGEEEMGSGKRYKEEHIWSSKIDSFNNSIHHNTHSLTPHSHSTTFCLNKPTPHRQHALRCSPRCSPRARPGWQHHLWSRDCVSGSTARPLVTPPFHSHSNRRATAALDIFLGNCSRSPTGLDSLG
jgi:hypothetical protein